MGWLFSSRWDTRAELRRHLVEENGVTTLKSCWVGNHMWAVHEVTPTQGERAGKPTRFICLYLTQNGGKYEGYGYKDVTEDMGPVNCNCPIGYIEMVEAHEKEHGYKASPGAISWRERVRLLAAKKARRLEAGQRIRLYGHEYDILADLGRGKYRVVGHSDSVRGITYQLPARMIKDVEVLA